MSGTTLVILTGAAALGSAAMGGVFFAFSAFVMGALRRLPPPEGIAAMQSINIIAVTPPFMIVIFGTALLCVVLIVPGVGAGREPGSSLRLAAAALYLISVVGVTMAFNVPRNNALAAITADSIAGAAVWAEYVPAWTGWNTVRMIAALAAAGLLIVSIVQTKP